jgi:serine protease Do
VTSVSEGSAASAAGLDRGDVITAIEGKSVRSFNGLRVRLAEYSPGDEVELTVNRSGEERVLYATLGAFEAASASNGGGPDDAPTLLRRDAFGATIEDVPGAGVRVTAVEPGSLAQRMGIAPGSVIVEINGVQVESASDYAAASSRINPAEGVRVFVRSPSGVGRYLFMRAR